MVLVELIEIYGIRINRKEAALLEIVMEHEKSFYREKAMRELAKIGTPEVLKYIVMNHPKSWYREFAMEALVDM